MHQSEVELCRPVQWARAQTIEMFSFYSRLLATSYLNMAVLKQAPQKQADLWSIPILNKRVVLWTWSESPSYGLLFSNRPIKQRNKKRVRLLIQKRFCPIVQQLVLETDISNVSRQGPSYERKIERKTELSWKVLGHTNLKAAGKKRQYCRDTSRDSR